MFLLEKQSLENLWCFFTKALVLSMICDFSYLSNRLWLQSLRITLGLDSWEFSGMSENLFMEFVLLCHFLLFDPDVYSLCLASPSSWLKLSDVWWCEGPIGHLLLKLGRKSCHQTFYDHLILPVDQINSSVFGTCWLSIDSFT